MPDDGITLRPIRSDDVDAVRDLQVAAWTALASGAHTPAQAQAHVDLIREPAYRTALLENNLILAWASDGTLLGSAGWCDVPDDPNAARIRKVFVAPRSAGTGIGRRLVSAAEDNARTKGRTRFTVRSNANAEGFYAKLGYRAVSHGAMQAAGEDLPVVFMEKTP